MGFGRIVAVFIAAAIVLIMAAPSDARAAKPLTLTGSVKSGAVALPGYGVTLYAMFVGPSARATNLGFTTTGPDGGFEITYKLPPGQIDQQKFVLFVMAANGLSLLANAIGAEPVPRVVVNERTTVAAGFAFAQFVNGLQITGNRFGMLNAAPMAANMADPETGAVGDVLGSPPNGPDTTALETFNSLANIVAACVATDADCERLFAATAPPGRPAPSNVLQAVANIAKFPWLNRERLFLLSLPAAVYGPARSISPDAWGLFLRFTGTDSSEQTRRDLMNGPGEIAIDGQGFLWVNDNYVPRRRLEPACAGMRLLKFFPWGENVPGSPFFGGGLSGAGFGITIAPNGHIWVGNFGFQAPECEQPGNPFGIPATTNSVSEFRPDGVAVSPDVTGYTAGEISWPQATESDRKGNIWLANCATDSVTVYPKGNPRRAFNIPNIGLDKPFGIAIGLGGDAWVTGSRNSKLAVIGRNGSLKRVIASNGNLTRPMGVAADSKGNIWVSNSDLLDVPCPPPIQDLGSATNPSVALYLVDGGFHDGSPFTGGGLTIPWGIAVDGNDTVWVANFGSNPKIDDPDSIGPDGLIPRVSHFCGVDESKCPPSKQRTGEPISPDRGYTSNALLRVTSLAVDPSGNVWMLNNWKELPLRINPGGNSIVVMVGAAGPMNTPVIGLPVPFKK